VRLAAKLAEMPVEEFIALNPGFSRPVIRAELTPRIVLPADRVDVFRENLTRHDDKSLVSWQTYQPKRGDTFEAIAKGEPSTPFLKFGDRLRIEMLDAAGQSVFGAIEQQVVQYPPQQHQPQK